LKTEFLSPIVLRYITNHSDWYHGCTLLGPIFFSYYNVLYTNWFGGEIWIQWRQCNSNWLQVQ